MTDFLYPFIEADERDATPLLADLARSAQGKWEQSTTLREETLARCDEQLRTVARAMAERFSGGGQLFTFGNGGSATDADGVPPLITNPPCAQPLPARSLAADQAVLTALSNDISLAAVFSRPLIPSGRAADIAFATSTRGQPENLLMAFAEARKRGMLTVGLAGYDGGRMAVSEDLEHCLVVRSDSVHRIQESQTSVAQALWALVQEEIANQTRRELSE